MTSIKKKKQQARTTVMLSSYEINCSSTQSDIAIKLIVKNYQIKKKRQKDIKE